MASEKTLARVPAEGPNEWFDRSKQPRCNLCGRFAYWDVWQWKLRCVSYNYDSGGYEHE